MTTKEKRKAIEDFCHSQPRCSDCPHGNDEFCKKYNLDTAPAKVVDMWYDMFFGDGEPHIKDSGTRRQFETGAVRDIQEGKGRCDLLPLDVIYYLYHQKSPVGGRGGVFYHIDAFVKGGSVEFLEDALESFLLNDSQWDKNWSTMFLEVAKHFEEGCKKYGENNWQKGIPTHCYIDSAVRHYLKWLRGDRDEPHDRAFCWNILCCIWTTMHKPELNDCAKKDTTERCVSCGDPIPEGRQVCTNCEGGDSDA